MTTPDHEGEAPLAAAVRASGDPELLPSAVIELHGSGHALRARQQLLRQIRWERDQTRAAKQRALAKDLRLWLEPVQHPPEMLTFYGIGTRLYGSHQAAQNGSHIATLWFVILYLPIWPIASYLVVDAPSGGWYFLARSPLPPVARTARRVFPWVIGALLAVLSWIPYQAGRRTDILVFNGFDRPVIADVGDQQVTVPPRADGAVRNLPLVVTRLRARWAGEDESFDSLAVDLSGHGRHRVIYNVAGRGVLELGYIVYGPGPDKEGRLLEAGPAIVLDEKIDYAFIAPPDSKRVSRGSWIRNSVLHAVDESAGPSALVLMLLEQGRPEQAQVVARSELMAHPEDANLAGVAAHGILQDDFDSQVALVRWCLERAPDAVDLHRLYQDLWPDDERQPIRQTYDSLLATNPRSAMHHYLVGRLDREGSSEALRHFRTALRLDPDYGPAHRALGYQAARDERWAEALAHYDLFAALGPAEALEATEVRLRLRRRERRSVDESLALLRETAELNPTAWWLHRLAAHISVERSPAALATQTDALLNKATAQFAIDSAAADWWNVAADLAVTAGELDAARSGLRQIPQAELRDVAVALRLALSTGATSADRELLVTIPDWYGRLGPTQRLMALGVLETTERGKAVSEIPRHLADIAQGLAAPGQLSGRESLQRQLSGEPLEVQVAASFAAAAMLATEVGPAAAAARRSFLERAWSLSVPGELPYGARLP